MDIATTNQTNTTEMGFVERDVKSVIGTMSVKHVQQFSLLTSRHVRAFYLKSVIDCTNKKTQQQQQIHVHVK